MLNDCQVGEGREAANVVGENVFPDVHSCTITVVLPAYNEEGNIGVAIDSISAYFNSLRRPVEIIVIDDGSVDNTARVANSRPGVKVLCNEKNLGKGEAVRRGALMGSGDLVLLMDADMATPIRELDNLIQHINIADIVVGSRYLPLSKILQKQPLLRRVNSKIFRLLARKLMQISVTDSQCGFKLLRSSAVQDVFSKPFLGRLSFDVEMLYRGRLSGHEIQEVPILWSHRCESRLHWRDLLMMHVDLLRLRFSIRFLSNRRSI